MCIVHAYTSILLVDGETYPPSMFRAIALPSNKAVAEYEYRKSELMFCIITVTKRGSNAVRLPLTFVELPNSFSCPLMSVTAQPTMILVLQATKHVNCTDVELILSHLTLYNGSTTRNGLNVNSCGSISYGGHVLLTFLVTCMQCINKLHVVSLNDKPGRVLWQCIIPLLVLIHDSTLIEKLSN